ncbi:MAG: dTDP-4-dehydrorhamnose reductase [bacterium]|nr:dTDP-4-dehydrorhamnose reductase [bacterium]
MKVLLTGSKGMLAKEFISECQKRTDYTIIALEREKCNITDFSSIRDAVRDIRPDVIINCASYTDVDGCERDQEKAFNVNGEGVKNLMQACRENDMLLVHFSTDFVFDGEKKSPYTEEDKPNPLNIYGKSKLLGEQYLLNSHIRFFLIRTSWMYGNGGRNFAKAVVDKVTNQSEISVVDDQIGNPTWVKDIVDITLRLLETKQYGIYNYSNEGECSWYEFACEIIKILQNSENKFHNTKVIPIKSAQLKRAAKRPAYSALNKSKIKSAVGIDVPHWRESLKKFLIEGSEL